MSRLGHAYEMHTRIDETQMCVSQHACTSTARPASNMAADCAMLPCMHALRAGTSASRPMTEVPSRPELTPQAPACRMRDWFMAVSAVFSKGSPSAFVSMVSMVSMHGDSGLCILHVEDRECLTGVMTARAVARTSKYALDMVAAGGAWVKPWFPSDLELWAIPNQEGSQSCRWQQPSCSSRP